ncbi:MAG: AraC family transcriptional regulator [Ruminococcus sp.]|nr:MAG: AraC family transcriptional regulator [Ruminococcus sp.]
MNNLQLLAHALSYMEEHMSESLRTEDIAAGCYCSKSSLEKLFRNVNNISVHDYIVRRKMVIAAKELQAGSANILELALSLGYNSNEAFTRVVQTGVELQSIGIQHKNTDFRGCTPDCPPRPWKESFL